MGGKGGPPKIPQIFGPKFIPPRNRTNSPLGWGNPGMLRLGSTEHWSPRNRISRNRDKGSPPPPGAKTPDPFFSLFAVFKKWSRDYRTQHVCPPKCRWWAGTLDFSPLEIFALGTSPNFWEFFQNVTSRNFLEIVTFQVTISARFVPRATCWQIIVPWKKNFPIINFFRT